MSTTLSPRIRVSFSPVEASILGLTGVRWWTIQELQDTLAPMSAEAVKSAVGYLRRRSLLAVWGQSRQSLGGEVIYHSTELGDELRLEFRRAELLNWNGGHHAAA
jgi:hypothetical protein